MRLIKPPVKYTIEEEEFAIFTAGSIEMGTAENWQTKVEKYFKNDDNIVILNPRRDDWDPSWVQSKKNPKFVEQVVWEDEGLKIANLVVLYFDPKTKSPISLLELGKFGHKMLVCCPDGFYRKGNVEVHCDIYKIPMYHTLEEMLKASRLIFSAHSI